MSYQNQKENDAHGAAASGAQREKALKARFVEWGLTLVKTKAECKKAGVAYDGNIRHDAVGEYAEAGFQYFLTDGYCPELNAIIELKGGDKQGTTEEKIFFDLLKIEDGAYGDKTLIYFFEGKKETDKCTKLFIHKLQQLQERGIGENVHVIPLSLCDAELLQEVVNA